MVEICYQSSKQKGKYTQQPSLYVCPLSVIWKTLCNGQEFLDKTRDALFAPNHSIIICRLAETIIQKLCN
jgi:hypothetical protein